MTDTLMATAMKAVMALDLDIADGRAGAMTLLRQIGEQGPGALERTSALLDGAAKEAAPA